MTPPSTSGTAERRFIEATGKVIDKTDLVMDEVAEFVVGLFKKDGRLASPTLAKVGPIVTSLKEWRVLRRELEDASAALLAEEDGGIE